MVFLLAGWWGVFFCFRFQVSGFKFQVSGFKFQVLGFGTQIYEIEVIFKILYELSSS